MESCVVLFNYMFRIILIERLTPCVFLLSPYRLKLIFPIGYLSLDNVFEQLFLQHQFVMFMELFKPLRTHIYSGIFIYVCFWNVHPLSLITLDVDSILFCWSILSSCTIH